MKMDAVDRLSIGATISGTDIFKKPFEGQVLAFDNDFKVIVIRTGSAKVDKSGICDVRFINLEHTEKFEVITEGSGPPKHLPNINYERLMERTRKNTEDKMQAVRYIGNGVTETAQNLMNFISRVFPECHWVGNDIYVMEQVIINPPYLQENCQVLDPKCQILDIIKQLITKFYRENKKT